MGSFKARVSSGRSRWQRRASTAAGVAAKLVIVALLRRGQAVPTARDIRGVLSLALAHHIIVCPKPTLGHLLVHAASV